MIQRLSIFLLAFCSLSLTLLEAADLNVIVDNGIKPVMSNKEIPGAAVGVYYDNQTYLYVYGVADKATHAPVTQDTLFAIASITKVFTSTLLALEVVNGNAELSDPAAKHLPFPELNDGPFRKVTLKDLATHTSSLPRMPPSKGSPYTMQQLMNFLAHWKPEYPIGTRYVYSNLGFGVLGITVANISEKPYFTLLQQAVLDPLNMKSTFFNVPPEFRSLKAKGYNPEGRVAPDFPVTILAPAGALQSSLKDMMAFLKANLGVEGSSNLLKGIKYAQQGYFKANENLTLGLGWQRYTKDDLLFIDKNGGLEGFSSYIGMVPDKKIGIVLLFNKGKTQSTTIGRNLLTKLIQDSNDL